MHATLLAHQLLLQGGVAVPPSAPPTAPDPNAWLNFAGLLLAALIGATAMWWIERRKMAEAIREKNTVVVERDRYRAELSALREEVRTLSGLPAVSPEPFQDALAKLRSVVLYRQSLVLDLTFEPIAESERLFVHMKATYTLVNYGKDPVSYKIRARMVPEGTDEGTRLVRISGNGDDLGGQSFDEGYPEQGAPERKVARDVVIPPNNQHPKNQFAVHMRNIASQNGSDVFYMLDPTVDVEVRVTKRPENLAVDVQFGHSARDEHDATPGRWQLRRAFLPWQSVHVTWSTQAGGLAIPTPTSAAAVVNAPQKDNAPT